MYHFAYVRHLAGRTVDGVHREELQSFTDVKKIKKKKILRILIDSVLDPKTICLAELWV